MSVDEPAVQIDGEHVSIEIVDERTARLAKQYVDGVYDDFAPSAADALADATGQPRETFEPDAPVPDFDDQPVMASETVDHDEPETSEDADQQADNGEQDATDDDADLPVSGQPWGQFDDRDDRVAAFIGAMYDHYEEPFQTTAGDIADVLEESPVGVSYSLKALDQFDVAQVDTSETGSAVWEVTPADSDSDTEVDDSPEHSPTIECRGRGGTREVDANAAVDAIANAPGIHRAKAPLSLDTTAMEDLLETLDLLEQFEADAPLSKPLVRETVEAYLEECGV